MNFFPLTISPWVPDTLTVWFLFYTLRTPVIWNNIGLGFFYLTKQPRFTFLGLELTWANDMRLIWLDSDCDWGPCSIIAGIVRTSWQISFKEALIEQFFFVFLYTHLKPQTLLESPNVNAYCIMHRLAILWSIDVGSFSGKNRPFFAKSLAV